MSSKRLRVFAGPNGSGKTTILKKLASEIPFGVYVNADDIEKNLKETNALLFDSFQINIEEDQIQTFFKQSQFAPIKRNEPDLWKCFKIKNNTLHVSCKIDSYIAADIADFIRYSLIDQEQSFTFETVMSHRSKIDFLKYAKSKKYRIYLYFSATKDPLININRVNNRVLQNGHPVEESKIINRYYRSIQLLKETIKLTDRAYIWDNSGNSAKLFAEISKGKELTILDEKNTPNWFINNVLE